MANAYATNYPVPGSANVLQTIWKLTRVMKKAGWNTVAHSNGSVKTSAGTNNNDSWGSGADPNSDAYPSFDAVNCWIVMRGPSTLKIPLSAAPSGTLLRGETIIQATTNAEGELLGYVWDSVSASGWAVVGPRSGTFNNSNVITGSSTGFTFTPTGTIVEYVREIMFAKTSTSDNTSGQIYYVCADLSAESSALFSTLASAAGCTASVPPGSGGTGNSFPSIGIACRGIGGSTTTAGWYGTTSNFAGNSNLIAINAIPSSGVTADGSFFATCNSSTPGQIYGFGFSRLDDTEPGDVDPYVFIHTTSGTFVNWSRTSNTGSGASPQSFSASNLLATTNPSMFGYQARGVSGKDVAAGYRGTIDGDTNVGYWLNIAIPALARQLSTPSSTPPILKEKISVVTTTGGAVAFLKHFKGKCRWVIACQIGSVLDTMDSKTYLIVSAVTSSLPSIMIPYDGSTTPL